MHCPELAPVHGMLSTSGSPPGEVNWGEFGTTSGVQTPVKVSSDSPLEHAVTDGAGVAGVGTTVTATAGAPATATANPPASSSRCAGSLKVAMIVLSVVVQELVLVAQTLRVALVNCCVIVNKSGAHVPFL